MNDKRLPLFIIAGMPRTATTFLYQRFQEHPGIFCPYRKETNFFSVNFGKGVDWYRGLYADAAPGQAMVDVSPVYFLDQAVIERVRVFEPRPLIVLGIRRATDWVLSWYTQVLSSHVGAKPSLEEFCTGYAYHISGGEIWQDFRNGFVRRMIEQYRETFGDGLLLYDYGAFRSAPLGVLNGIERFVGVPRYFSDENFRNEVVNAGTRRNSGLLAYLLKQERFVDAVGRLFPRRLVQAGRNLYVKFGSSKEPPPPPSFSDEEIALANAIFSADDRWIESLFADASMQLGSGTVFGEA